MADVRITDFHSLINQQIHFQESVLEHLLKAQALIHVALAENSPVCNDTLTHTYLWVLDDIVDNAKNTSEHALNRLLKTSTI